MKASTHNTKHECNVFCERTQNVFCYCFWNELWRRFVALLLLTQQKIYIGNAMHKYFNL